MTATANRDKNTKDAFMAPVSGKIAEAALSIMQYFGIRKIEIKKLESANFERISAAIEPFDGIPAELNTCAILIKDALASILASVGVVNLEMTASEEENAEMVKGYNKLVDIKNGITVKEPIVADAVIEAADDKEVKNEKSKCTSKKCKCSAKKQSTKSKK